MKLEALNNTKIIPPATVELYNVGGDIPTSLPSHLLENSDLVRLAEFRRRLNRQFDKLFQQISDPKTDFNQAIISGQISQNDIATLWNQSAEFLDQDQNHARLLLYFPFQFLPNMTDRFENFGLDDSAQKFAKSYRESWLRLLFETESRANFVDGDILEEGLPEPEKVSKAGHLIPELLKKGLVSISELTTLLNVLEDPIILKSVSEGLSIAHQINQVSEHEWQNISKLINQKVPILGAIKYDLESFPISPARAAWLDKQATENSLRLQGVIPIQNAIPDAARVALSTPLSISLTPDNPDLQPFIRSVATISTDPFLKRVQYPTILFFGSRLKGYGDPNSDYDIAIFLKPEARVEESEIIRRRLLTVSPVLKKVNKILEYWIEDRDGQFNFRNVPENPYSIGWEQSHFFLGGALVTGGNEYQNFYYNILDQYLNTANHNLNLPSRTTVLGHLELDSLQYRLMHKGYRRFYPYTNPAPVVDLIDGQSDFWDPGYRRVATKLFLSRVFLPELSS